MTEDEEATRQSMWRAGKLLALSTRPTPNGRVHAEISEAAIEWRTRLYLDRYSALANVSRDVSMAVAQKAFGGHQISVTVAENAQKILNSIAIAASSVLIRGLNESAELQKTYDAALFAMGWWLPPSVSIPFYMHVGGLAVTGNRIEVRHAMTDYAMSQDFQRAVDHWFEIDVFKHRRRFLQDGILDHRRRRYRVSIPTLLPHIEGITVDAFQILDSGKKKNPKSLIDLATESYDDVMGPAMVEAMSVLWGFTDFISSNPRALNRHMILHGRSTNYASEENSAKVLFALDLLSFVVIEARRNPEWRANKGAITASVDAVMSI
jgi:hypothetical protein